MVTVPITESMLAVALAVAFLAAALLAVACYRPFGVRGDPLDTFLVVAALLLIGSSGGFGVEYLVRSGGDDRGSFAPPFLVCILSALIFTAIYVLRRKGEDKGEGSKGGPQ